MGLTKEDISLGCFMGLTKEDISLGVESDTYL